MFLQYPVQALAANIPAFIYVPMKKRAENGSFGGYFQRPFHCSPRRVPSPLQPFLKAFPPSFLNFERSFLTLFNVHFLLPQPTIQRPTSSSHRGLFWLHGSDVEKDFSQSLLWVMAHSI